MATPVEHLLLQALTELDAVIKAGAPGGPKPDLLPRFARIDELARKLSPESNPALRHYLRQKSYEKARRCLEGRDAENQAGNCAR
jgi:hypothetical protein